MLVAVAEDVVSQGKAPGEGTASGAVSVESAFRVVSAMTAFAAAVLATQPGVSFAQALPTGGQVTAGQASISQNSNTMTINQGTQRAVIDWNSFNVGAGNTVQFNQPNAQSQALNRVTSGGASNIQGSLLANGQVLIQNANGVLFGKGSVVNVGSLLATTKAINPDAFMAGGPLQLSSTGTNASVQNDGSIQAQGYVTLVGDQVRNTGSINTAQGGQVVLAAGDSATVALPNGQGIQLTLTNATANALVENSGTINAQNGSVLLTARGTNTLLNTVVNLDGVTRAGTVVADAGNTGDVAVTGKVDASNNAAGGVGGTVVLSGTGTDIGPNASINTTDNGTTNNGGNGNGTDNGGNTDAHGSSGGSSAAGTAAAVVGGIGLAGGLSYLIYENAMHMYLDEAQPLTLELGDAAFWADATVQQVSIDLTTDTADVDLLTRAGALTRHMQYRDGADGVKHYTFEDEKKQTKADLSVNMQTREYFYTESGVKDGKPYVVKSHGWLKQGMAVLANPSADKAAVRP
ncbi:filamentous hemagglutinin N-terminal domain-containing protein (plasmid) [Caballeronia sp. M1242]|nr:filamentous hemagglutinin N-terminal domain-containing protein [Caballeronia sp. M1242]QSN64966.1 filamentous hemagglutinin N-terminal domain-containing protein [Caballeronia sp. M1242]